MHGTNSDEVLTQVLARAAALASAGRQEARQEIDHWVQTCGRTPADIHYNYLWRRREIERELTLVALPERPPEPTYVMGALFLEHCRQELTRDEKEAMFYVSGLEQDGRIYLTDILTFDMSHRSLGGVHGDDQSVFRAVMKLRQAGQSLYGWFHSHPGVRDACAPSSIDIATQKRLEGLNYPAIGAIFTRDGYLRFFSVDRQSRSRFTGKE